MATVYMKLGDNLGNILLEISQTAISEGNPQKAIDTYTKSLIGFTKDHALAVLKNQLVLITDKNGTSISAVSDSKHIASNQHNLQDWNCWTVNKIKELQDNLQALYKIKDIVANKLHENVLDCNIVQSVKNYFGSDLNKWGRHNIAARLIAGYGFGEFLSNGENSWQDLCDNVENEHAEKHEEILYYIVKYVSLIKHLHTEYMKFSSSIDFLLDNKLAERPLFFEDIMEKVCSILWEFSDTNLGYYHPLCNTQLYIYKEKLSDEIISTKYGNAYAKYKIIEKNIMDGYDAGWLSPDGKFFGENGETSSMIHLRLSEALKPNDSNSDVTLEREGWIKIHHDEVYGCFIGEVTPSEDFPYAFCPTETQIKMVCSYIDKFYKGTIYTQPKIIKAIHTSTYKVRQMDKFKLHELFN